MNLPYYYFLYSSIFNAIVITILGVLVYLKNPKGKLNQIFALFCLAIGEWAYTYIGWPLSKTAEDTLYWFQLLHIGACFVSIIYLHLVINWLNFYNKLNNYIIKVGYILSAFFALNVFSPYFIADMRPIFSMRFWAVPGILYHFYLVVFFSLFFYATYLLYISLKVNTGIKRKQIQFVLFGMVLTFLGGSTNYFLWYGINIPPYGNLFGASFVMLTAYAILKYRFMDIRIIIKRSAVFALLVVTITTLYTLFAYLISVYFQDLIKTQSFILNGIITAVLVAFGFEPLKKALSEWTDQYFFKAEYNPQEVLGEFSENLSSILYLDKLSAFVVKKLHSVFKNHFVSLFLLNEKANRYERINVDGVAPKQLTVIDKSLFTEVNSYLHKIKRAKEILVRDEIKKINEELKSPVLDLLYKQMSEYEVSLLVPLYIQDKLVGMIFLADKKSGDIYTQEDIRVLEIIAGQAAVAIQNASLYEEQKQFAITLKKEVDNATKELKIANIQLKKLDRAKSEFISIASHQLRTPLTIIKGYVSMINDGDFGNVPGKIHGPLDKVFKSTLRIINLVEDLLNISRIESGRMKFELSEVNIIDLVKEVCDELKFNAEKKGLSFECQIDHHKLPELVMDRSKMREVVMNLIDNAIKYTPSGFVRVILKRQNNDVFYCVEDSGRGIEPDQMPLLFQKFSRTTGTELIHTEGTGLGLYIAKQLVHKHGGQIWAESPGKDKGSKFCITFKIKNPKLENEMKKAESKPIEKK